MIAAPTKRSRKLRAGWIVAVIAMITGAVINVARAVDLEDFADWPACVTGPHGGPLAKGCGAFDRDGDDDVDLQDFARFQRVFGLKGFADDCADAEAIAGEGTFPFDNTTATLDGPAHAACRFFGEDRIDRDLWACWRAPCSATVFVGTCDGTAVDTKIAVYEGCGCPVADARLLSCNDDACDVQSLAAFEAIAGQDYLVRLGTFPGEPGGTGVVNITCGLESCPGTGACHAVHDGPGCDDAGCCETVCTRDPFCCDSDWDDVCVEEARGLCGGSFTACGPGTGDCTVARPFVCVGGANDGKLCDDDDDCPEGTCAGRPGCDDETCCNAVCRLDPFCCLDTWDGFCTEREAAVCFGACVSGSGDCSIPNGSAGCNDESCCALVCPQDPFCCQIDWDQTCADTAGESCP